AFGHTGFTGICVWADPENDLLFVFLSNRVHPDPSNNKISTYKIRKRLHQVFYDQLKYNGVYKNKNYPKGYIKESGL
ncbi:MAG: serine hydrolase, partial [Flavobacteriales bacterium]|nr:serine hydrolase [Flavobacteriales bacterium]